MDDDRARDLLAAARARVEHALAELQSEPHGADADAADGGADLLEEQIGETLTDDLREELALIERAEQRLAEGAYGRSVVSGEPIPDARLEVVPWAERTADEQAIFEGSGA